MTTKGVKAFTEWMVANGRATPEKAARMCEIMGKVMSRLKQ